MSKIRLLCAAVLLFCAGACAKSQNIRFERLQDDLELDRKLLRETRAELQALVDRLKPLVELASRMDLKRDFTSGGATSAHSKPELGPSPPLDDEDDQTLEDGIEKLGDTHYRIDRDLLDKFLQNPGTMSRGARIVPSIKGGQANGFKLYAIRPSSVYAKIGLMNGDTIHRVNGHDVTSPDKALEAYTKVRNASDIRLDITRRGKAAQLLIEIH